MDPDILELKLLLDKITFEDVAHIQNYVSNKLDIKLSFVDKALSNQALLVRYITMCSDNAKQKLCISTYICNKWIEQGLKLQNIYILINEIKHLIPLDVYMLFIFKLHYYNLLAYDLHSNIMFIINNLKQEHLLLLSYVINNNYISPKYEMPITNKIISLIFNKEEQSVFFKCFSKLDALYSWLFAQRQPIEYTKFNVAYLRYMFIYDLFSANYDIYDDISCDDLRDLRDYFAEELKENYTFIKLCCKYLLLTKYLIKQIYDTNNHLAFDLLMKHQQQFTEYINSLEIMRALTV